MIARLPAGSRPLRLVAAGPDCDGGAHESALQAEAVRQQRGRRTEMRARPPVAWPLLAAVVYTFAYT